MDWNTVVAVCMGIGLSAACGFRVFLPLLGVSVGQMMGWLTPSPGFEWLGSQTALITFASASVLEVVAYYFPAVDHALDTLTTPAAVVAGTILTASTLVHLDPYTKWTLAIIAGGGTAGLMKGKMIATRSLSTLMTGGLGNPILSTIELVISIVMSALAIFLPILAIVLVGIFFFAGFVVIKKLLHRRDPSTSLGMTKTLQ